MVLNNTCFETLVTPGLREHVSGEPLWKPVHCQASVKAFGWTQGHRAHILHGAGKAEAWTRPSLHGLLSAANAVAWHGPLGFTPPHLSEPKENIPPRGLMNAYDYVSDFQFLGERHLN